MNGSVAISSRALPLAGLFAAALVVSFGTAWAFDRGAQDFSVFFESWKLVLGGRGAEIYRATPDRFLYAPGFAWLLSPLALLPRGVALALWCLAKAAIVGLLIRELGASLFATVRGAKGIAAAGLAAWGVVLLARPILIDFQYGQVNLLILGAAFWALLCHREPGIRLRWAGASWALLTFAALAKVFPLPLLAVPWLAAHGVPARRLRVERLAILSAAAVVAMLPLLALGPDGALALTLQWKDAVLAKGLPLETHNQSFAAFLHHFFTDKPAHVIARGADGYFVFGLPLFSEATLALLVAAWSFVSLGALLAWLASARDRSHPRWIAVAVAGVILPSHLVWKPYFVMFLPLAIVVIRDRLRSPGLLLALFAAINLTGFDVLGPRLGSWLEAGAVLFWAGLALVALGARERRAA